MLRPLWGLKEQVSLSNDTILKNIQSRMRGLGLEQKEFTGFRRDSGFAHRSQGLELTVVPFS